MDLSKILEKQDNCVAIVHYRLPKDDQLYHGGGSPQNPACLLQVSVLKSKLSPSKKLIRFGDTSGDEIIGWTKLDALEVVEVLGVLQSDGKTVKPMEYPKFVEPQWPPEWSLEARPHEAA